MHDDDKPLTFTLPDSPVPLATPRHHLVEPGSLEVGSIGKERELRELRSKVEMLTEQLSESQKRLVAPLTARMSHEEQHGYKCGRHPVIEVSMETASVTCRVCGAELSPLDVLREYARSERYFVQGLESLRKEKAALAEEVDKLKKYRGSLRSQIRKKGGDVPDDPNCTRPSAKQYYALATKYHHLVLEHEELKKKVSAS